VALPAHLPVGLEAARPEPPAPAGPPRQPDRMAGSTSRSPRLRALGLQLAAVLVVLALWTAVRAADLVGTLVLPSPLAVLHALLDALVTARFWAAVGFTLEAAAMGLLLSLLVGVPLGLITGVYVGAERSSRLIVDVGRAFPVFAILPVLILVIGATTGMKVACVFIACVFPVWLQAQYGAQSLDETIQETVRSYRIPRMLRFGKVVLPAALPSIMTGIRLAATTSVLVCVGVEILTSVHGIGARITALQVDGASAGTYAYVLVCGVVGFAITKLSELAEDRVLRWRPPAEHE
jgi:ABC-type nitrate/sulfonate/bicarbonate transport system permease component